MKRHWKEAFESNFDPEAEANRSEKTGFTKRQKDWIKRAYIEYFGELFCVFPVWEKDKFTLCRTPKIEIHHVIPQGFAKRVLSEIPDRPSNAVPICPMHHRKGDRSKPLTREDQDVIHLDNLWADRNYKGKNKPTSYDLVFQQRRKLTLLGVEYWVNSWDSYLLEVAELVSHEYSTLNPQDKWPSRA